MLKDRNGTRFYKNSFSLNGVAQGATDFVNAISELTSQNNINLMTMSRWSEILTGRGLLRKVKAWCPECYEEWRANNQVIYEPLIWALNAIDICLYHEIMLVSNCYICNQKISQLERRSKPGYCSKCGNWMGRNLIKNDLFATESDFAKKKWIATNIGQLLSITPPFDFIMSRKTLKKSIVLIVDNYFNGNISFFAKNIGVSKTTAWGWYAGDNLPSIEMLLVICYTLNLKITDFLFKSTEIINQKLNNVSRNSKMCNRYVIHRRLQFEKIKIELERVIENREQPPPSVQEISRRLGIGGRVLYNHFPELCRKISSSYMVSVKESRVKKIAHNQNLVIGITRMLHNEGIYPSRHRVQVFAKGKGVYWEKEMQYIWRDTVKEINGEYLKTN